MVDLTIKNSKIIEFYNKYTINFEEINLMIVDILENVILNLESDIIKNLSSDILEYISIQKKDKHNINLEFNNVIKDNLELIENNQTSTITILTVIKNTISELNSEINNSIITRFHNIKNNYVGNTKLIFEKSCNNNIYKNLEDENENLKNKIIHIINNILPKDISTQYTDYISIINNFKEDMSNNIEQYKKNNSPIDKIQTMFIEKYNTLATKLQNNIIDYYISLTEDKINYTLNEIKIINNQSFFDKEYINDELKKFLVQNKISLTKCHCENILLEQILLHLLPSAEIIVNTNKNNIETIIIKRVDKPTILLDSKNYHTVNIPVKDINQFTNTVEKNNYDGILISQRTGIVSKHNFEIDIINGNILIYIHRLAYNPKTLLIAIDIIDNLSDKFKDSQCNESLIISESSLIKINEQYQKFLIKKDEIIHQINENAKNLINMIKSMELSELNYVLSSKTNLNKNLNITVYKCNKCNVREFTNLKSLSNHRRYCNIDYDDDNR